MWILGSLRCINFQIQSYSLLSSELSLQGQNYRGFAPCPYLLSLCFVHYRQLTLSGQKVQYNRLSTVKCYQIQYLKTVSRVSSTLCFPSLCRRILVQTEGYFTQPWRGPDDT
jgi:hypothetical protein